MKVVAQHSISNCYLTLRNEWRPDIEDARLFDSACDAVTFSFKYIKPPYNVVLKFDDTQYDLTVSAGEDGEIGSMEQSSREMIRSSNRVIAEARDVVAKSKKVMAASKKSLAKMRRNRARK